MTKGLLEKRSLFEYNKNNKRWGCNFKTDTITKDYIPDTEVFADVFNYYIYDGEQVILPEQLEERDSTELVLPYGADGSIVPIQKFRDAQKLCTAMWNSVY